MFAGLGTGQLADLERAAFVRRLARGQVLFVEGEPVDNLYVVRDGGLKVHLVAEHGAELLLSILGPGSVLGDVSLIDRGPRSATVTALQASELLAVPQDIVRSLLAGHPAALWAVAEGLAAGVRRLTSHSAGLIFLDLPRRLAKLLLDSASPAPDGTLIVHLPVTQTDLAAMLRSESPVVEQGAVRSHRPGLDRARRRRDPCRQRRRDQPVRPIMTEPLLAETRRPGPDPRPARHARG